MLAKFKFDCRLCYLQGFKDEYAIVIQKHVIECITMVFSKIKYVMVTKKMS